MSAKPIMSASARCLCRSRNERRFVGDAKFSPRPGAFRRGAAYLKGMKQLRILMVPALWAAMALPAAAAEKLSLAEISALTR